MVKRSIQGYVELASGLGEMTRAKAVEAAQEIIALGGSDASRKKVARQASRMADELLKAAEQNRRQIVALVQREVEGALGRVDVNRLMAEVQSLAGTVAALAGQVDELARTVTGRGSQVVTSGLSVAEEGPEPARVAPRSAPSGSAPARKAPAAAAKATTAAPSATSSSAAKTPEKSTTTAEPAAGRLGARRHLPVHRHVEHDVGPDQRHRLQFDPAGPAVAHPVEHRPADLVLRRGGIDMGADRRGGRRSRRAPRRRRCRSAGTRRPR